MAKQQRRSAQANMNTSSVKTQRFDKELTEDIQDYHLGESQWTHARNAITNSATGDFGDIGNEPSNVYCAQAPYTVIGTIHIQGDVWMIFSTDDSNSAIGLFDESKCLYQTVVDDPCLGFRRTHLIIGASKENYDCRWSTYFSDALNPDRFLTVDVEDFDNNLYTNPESTIPWIQNCIDDNGATEGGCIICTNTPNVDCSKLRLETLIKPPCFRVEKGSSSGTVRNGSYFVVGAYVINGQRINDYSVPSNVQPVFVHDNLGGSLDVFVEFSDTRFDEYELVLVSFFNEQTTARRVGIYSTRQKKIALDYIDDRWPAVSLDQIPIRTQIADKSDAIYRNGNYLLRVGPTSKFDFNYQPQANQIRSKWVSVEYPEAYYYEGGNKTGYLRDEVYSFFIRWVYETGDKSASYHIPGRPLFTTPQWFNPSTGAVDLETNTNVVDEIELAEGLTPYNWVVYNTAVVTPSVPSVLPDGGQIIAEGYMGYWESEEFYADNNPDVWNSGVGLPPYPNTNPNQYDLCGKPIRHHKFPDNAVGGTNVTNHYECNNTSGDGCTIRVLGVKFENVLPPVDNNGNPIPGIVGYEILRGSRLGNATILAKGIINNMFEYDLDGDNDSSVNLVSNRTGLYPNYPYNDMGPDPYISTTETNWEPLNPVNPYVDVNPNTRVNKRIFSFHSPDTQFTDPFLSSDELKIYGEVNGIASGNFAFPDQHPKHKLVTDLAFWAGVLAGIGYAMVAMNGKRTIKKSTATRIDLGGAKSPNYTGTFGVIPLTLQTFLGGIPSAASDVASQAALVAQDAALTAYFVGDNTLDLLDTLLGTNTATNSFDSAASIGSGTSGFMSSVTEQDRELNGSAALPGALRVLSNGILFYNYFVEGVDTTLKVIKTFSRYQQYALQYQSHCKYGGWRNNVGNARNGQRRRRIQNARYVDPYFTDFGSSYKINNLNRNRMVTVEVDEDVAFTQTTDNTKFTLQTVQNDLGVIPDYKKPNKGYTSTAASHYVAFKQRARNQYGQLDSIVQVPVSTCQTKLISPSTEVLFNGDTYIGRHTEKNTMPFFYDWLYQQVDGTEFNYKNAQMVPNTTYWMNTETFEWSDFINSFSTAFASLSPSSPGGFFSSFVTPSDLHCMDRQAGANSGGTFNAANGIFILKNAYMYLFNSGIRDFFVESSINVDLRDWGEADNQRHYHPYSAYTNVKDLFNTSIIKLDNYFKYDSNLSINKLFNNYISWGNLQVRNYNPFDAATCYVHRPKRIIYSLPQNTTDYKVDNWRIFLPFNYKDFVSKITAVKPIFTSGAIILFENESPILFKGVEELTTASDTKITIGDGGLFNQPLQNMSNSDRPYEYGSCQNRLSFVNTPYGGFYMGQNQGKIFAVAGAGLAELSIPGGLKWWFANFLPYQLTVQVPDFELLDNPVIGIGCQAIYDNTNSLVYFCKKDYKIKDGVAFRYEGDNLFLIDGLLRVELGDPRYFDDASWTVSYDLKNKVWIGWHDWHPDLLMGGKTNFMSIVKQGTTINPVTGLPQAANNAIWVHNDVCDSYGKFYGTDYPFEVEFPINSLQTVNTLRSIEYQLESYVYDSNCYDRFHVLDFNFDEAIIHNSEQCSGLLRLNISPKNDPGTMLLYPIINPGFIDILYSKEEQKYRFNQFWDITDDRGEFTGVERMIWNTQPNGYVKLLNPINMNYQKYQTERKKFRHYETFVFLRRVASGNKKMLVMITNGKNLNSPR